MMIRTLPIRPSLRWPLLAAWSAAALVLTLLAVGRGEALLGVAFALLAAAGLVLAIKHLPRRPTGQNWPASPLLEGRFVPTRAAWHLLHPPRELGVDALSVRVDSKGDFKGLRLQGRPGWRSELLALLARDPQLLPPFVEPHTWLRLARRLTPDQAICARRHGWAFVYYLEERTDRPVFVVTKTGYDPKKEYGPRLRPRDCYKGR